MSSQKMKFLIITLSNIQGKRILKFRVEFTEDEVSHNNLEQYTRKKDIEIQGIPSEISDEKLKEKVVEVFGAINIAITKSVVEDCHRLDKNLKITIYCLVCE